MVAVGDLDNFGGQGAEAPLQYMVDAGNGQGGVVGIAEAEPASFQASLSTSHSGWLE